MRYLVLVGVAALAGGCEPADGGITLVLTSPSPVEIRATTPNAFVDRTYEPWFVMTSPGLGDNPSDESALRLSLTTSAAHAVIDNHASAALLFRMPGFHDCDRFAGTVNSEDSGAQWSVSIDAMCLSAPEYSVRGVLRGQ